MKTIDAFVSHQIEIYRCVSIEFEKKDVYYTPSIQLIQEKVTLRKSTTKKNFSIGTENHSKSGIKYL